MKLDDIVDPVEIHSDSFDRSSLLTKDVLSHLLVYLKKDRTGKQWKIKDIYRAVATDILTYAGVVVSELSSDESNRRIVYIAKKLESIDKKRRKLVPGSKKKDKDDFMNKILVAKFKIFPESQQSDLASESDNFENEPPSSLQNTDSLQPIFSESQKSDPTSESDNFEPPSSLQNTDSLQPLFLDEGTMSSCHSIPDNTVADPDFRPPEREANTKKPSVTVKSLPLEKMAAELARSGAGSEDNARICTNMANICYEEWERTGPRPVITRSMIERVIRQDGIERVLALEKLNMRGLYFDGKKSRIRYEKDGKTRYLTADHYTMVMQPEKKYCGFCKTNGKAEDIAARILEFLETYKVQTDKLICLGGDATAVNSGPLGGAFHHLEKFLGRALQRSVCLLHHVELVFRAIFYYYDGNPKGCGSYRGRIGQLIEKDVWDAPVKNFKKIELNFEEFDDKVVKKMSCDRQLLYKLIVGISKGDISEVKDATIGPVHQARWLTLASRILRLYCSPPDNLETYWQLVLERLVNFIVKVYFKMFSAIKHRNTIIDGARHLFNEIQLVKKFCTEEERKVAYKTIQDNAWFAHPENILIAMCGDTDENVRFMGRNVLRNLLKIEDYHKKVARRRIELHDVTKKRPIREFHMPEIDFDASSYMKMVKLTTRTMKGPLDPPKITVFPIFTVNYKGPKKYQQLTMPPLVAHMSADQIDEIEDCRLTSDFECHTQSVERGVALTAQSVKRRRTDATQLRMALSTLAAREKMKEPVTKKRFKENFPQFAVSK